MINVILWFFFGATVGIILLMVLENQVEDLPPSNKFKAWWRKNVIGDDIYGDDF
jgi:hypothetical protein